MNIKERLMNDLKQAMKENNTIKKNTIQMIRAAILTEEKNSPVPLTELEIENIVAKQRKIRQDALAEFEKANRKDLIENTNKEILCVSEYLPQPISEIELREGMLKIVQELNAKSKDLGNVIRKAKELYGNRTDARTISIIAKELLSM